MSMDTVIMVKKIKIQNYNFCNFFREINLQFEIRQIEQYDAHKTRYFSQFYWKFLQITSCQR